MRLTIRLATPDDAVRCGTICYQAFKALAEQHRFPPDWPSAAAAVADFERRLTRPGYYAIVAETEGRIIGSAVLDERSPIAGLGPITVDPAVQNRMIGHRLMQALLDRVSESHCPGVRLVQNTYHNRSLCLYAKLGFEVRELLVNLQGPPLGLHLPVCTVRQASEGDLDGCNALCRRIHRHDRHGELLEAIQSGTATVVERGNRISGYATIVGFSGHAVGESNIDLQALIGAAPEFGGPGFILPARNGELFRWCLAHGLRVVQPLTLMSLGLYNEPEGSFLPSITY
ncbi:MAG: GNAT family N-acetyltransferase [Methylococcaceae bacterium]|nr:GNAT family N-acetyltransferase [Methylococcaceae bacterium]